MVGHNHTCQVCIGFLSKRDHSRADHRSGRHVQEYRNKSRSVQNMLCTMCLLLVYDRTVRKITKHWITKMGLTMTAIRMFDGVTLWWTLYLGVRCHGVGSQLPTVNNFCWVTTPGANKQWPVQLWEKRSHFVPDSRFNCLCRRSSIYREQSIPAGRSANCHKRPPE